MKSIYLIFASALICRNVFCSNFDSFSVGYKSSKYLKDMRNMVSCTKSPEMFFSINYDYENVIVIYAAMECQRKGIILPSSKKVVKSLIYLIENDIDKIYYNDKTMIQTLVFLQKYTFMFNENFTTILKWWDKIGSKTSRKEWAVSKVDLILKNKKHLNEKDKLVIFCATQNQRIYFLKINDFKDWWGKNRLKSFRDWGIDTLTWAIDNIDSCNAR